MKTGKAFLCGVLLAACGGKTTPKNDIPMGSKHDTVATVPTGGGTTAPAPDPALGFRLGFANPGGMWMPGQMTLPQHTEIFHKMGVKLDANVLADPLAAPLAGVVWLGGCTASFVSDQGLIVTNHHCVQGALQLNSTPDNNLVDNGFLAKTLADEKTAGPTQHVMVAQAFRDVTHDMRDGLDQIKDPTARKDETEKRMKALVAACEKGRAPDIRCNVSSYFEGGQYILQEMLDIRDVRLVYVPARSVGDYGGEIDNWEWPRHTGDWSFYRAYVGPDGKPADFDAKNVPYKSTHHLHVTTAGLKPGDFVMVTGYPGRTNRTTPASEIHHDLEWVYPNVIEYYAARYKVAEDHLKDGGETAIKATVAKQGIQNGLEKFQGIQLGFQKNPELIKQKDALDKKAKDWAALPGHEAYKAAIEKYEALLADEFRTARVDFERGAVFGGSRLLSTALAFTRWADERTKKDEDRKPGYQDRDMKRAEGGQRSFAKQYDRTLDRAYFRLALVRAAAMPEADRPWLALLLDSKKAKIDEALIDRTLDAWYKAQQIEDEKLRLELLTKGTAKLLKASKDPFVQAAQRIWPTVKAEEKKTDARQGEMVLVAPMYVEAMKNALGGALAPDANSTLRVTYGTVKSLKPESKELADAPFTVASQILAKDTGKEPFNSPQKLLTAIKAKQFGKYGDPMLGGELPIDFESDLDITGGNSGSPTLNDKGELVGLAFDGNKEGLASDVVFNGVTTRTIHVDARYMIWTMDTLDGAKHLVKEMGLQPTP